MKEINIGQATALTSPDPLVLVCTRKEDGGLNMAPVSFFMYASFEPPMLAFAMGKAANSGANIRRTGKAVLAVPGVGLREAVMKYGSSNGGRTDKLKETPVALQKVAGSDIPIPEDSRSLLPCPLRRRSKQATTACTFAASTVCSQMRHGRPCSLGTAMRELRRRRRNDVVCAATCLGSACTDCP